METRFINLCKKGDLIWLQQLLKLNPEINISAINDEAFRYTCANGHLHVAQWLLQVSKEKGQDINISAENEFAFRWACYNGHLEVAQWLLRVSKEKGQDISISAKNEYAFRNSCSQGHLHVCKWLKTLNPNYEIINEDRPNWSCIIKNPKDIKWEKNKKLVALASQPGNIVGDMPTDLVRMTASYL